MKVTLRCQFIVPAKVKSSCRCVNMNERAVEYIITRKSGTTAAS